MSSLFVMLKSFWMEFLEQITKLIFLSLTEGTEVLVNLIEEDIWEAKDKQTGALNYEVKSWD